jgi:hypothetical protein
MFQDPRILSKGWLENNPMAMRYADANSILPFDQLPFDQSVKVVIYNP